MIKSQFNVADENKLKIDEIKVYADPRGEGERVILVKLLFLGSISTAGRTFCPLCDNVNQRALPFPGDSGQRAITQNNWLKNKYFYFYNRPLFNCQN